MPAPKRTSCGVIVTDGARILLGHATNSPRWDIPKGIAEPGEDFRAAAARELREETGLEADPAALIDLGVHAYFRTKDLALFAWRPASLPDPAALICGSMVIPPSGPAFPELDRFAVLPWGRALALVGRNLATVLKSIRPRL